MRSSSFFAALATLLSAVWAFEFTMPPEGRMDGEGEYILDRAQYTYIEGSSLEIAWSWTPILEGKPMTLELYYSVDDSSFTKAGTLFTGEEGTEGKTTYSWTVDRGLSDDEHAIYYLSISNEELKPVNTDLFKIVSKPKSSTKKPTSTSTTSSVTKTAAAEPTNTADSEVTPTPKPEDTTAGDSNTDSPTSESTNPDSSSATDGSSTTDPDTTNASAPKKKGGLGGGAIAGMVIGIIAAIALIGAAAWYFAKKRRAETHYPAMAEVEANHKVELSTDAKPVELNAQKDVKPQIYELSSDNRSH